jgi:hypothetical protein
MRIDISRLRAGEVASGLGGVVLLGWRGRRQFGVLRWLSLVTGVSALALTYTQATRRAPALPVALSVLVSALGFINVVGLVGRAFVDRTHGSSRLPGTRFGLLAAITITGGGYASMRKEKGPDPGELGELETITL